MSLLNHEGDYVLNAMQEVQFRYGLTTEPAGRSYHMYGRNHSVGTTVETLDVMGSEEVLPTSNTIDTISSSSTSDVGNIVVVYGHKFNDGGDLIEVSPAAGTIVTLNGQNKVTLPEPMARVYLAVMRNTNVGDVWIYEDTAITGGVPTDTTKRHLMIEEELGRSSKGVIVVPSDHIYVVTKFYGTVNQKTSGAADIQVHNANVGDDFTLRFAAAAGQKGSGFWLDVTPHIPVPPNHDIMLKVVADTPNVDVTGGLFGYWLRII